MTTRENTTKAIHDVLENLPPEDTQAYAVAADAVLADFEAAGLVIVPREPTEAMIDACPLETNEQIIIANWRAMIDAANQ
jgi:hypothetical protein